MSADRECSMCMETFPNLSKLKKHRKLKHFADGNVTPTCDLCNKSYSDKYGLQKHRTAEHTSNPEKGNCDQCEKTFQNEHKLRNHMAVHKERKFPCEHCHLRFLTNNMKEEHVNRQHLKLKNVSCAKCDYEGYSKNDLNCHNINKHSGLKPYKCSICPMSFPRVSPLYTHQETHKNMQKTTRDHPCQICGKMFKSRKGPVRCAKIHKSEGNYQCTVEGCETKFTNLIKKKWHERRYHSDASSKSDSLTIPCHKCDMAFGTKSDLKRHIFYMHEEREKVIPCPDCPKMFVSSERLKRHVPIHSGTSFKCPFEGCDVKHKLQYNLNHHYKEKHGKVQHRKSLVERINKATEEVPCTLCNKSVKKKCLTRHMKAHDKQDLMKCILPECAETIRSARHNLKQSYDISSELYEHLQTNHLLNLDTNTVSVEFKCKHCSETLHAKSTRPQENNKLWNYQTTKNWSTKLANHIISKHEVTKENLDIKNDWETHYEKGSVSVQERDGKEKEEMHELQQILDTLKCKLCSFVALGSSTEVKRKSLLGHYCQEHFTDPMTRLAKEDIEDSYCKRCKAKFDFKQLSKKLIHVGYKHKGLYPYLKSDSEIDLRPFVEKITNVKEKQSYPCNECGKLFNQKANYMAHMVYHSDERPFPCEVCVKAFKTLRDLDIHKRTHNGEKPFGCKTCQTAFSQSATLWSHEKRYHCNGKFTCKDCKEMFTTGWYLKTHRTSACTLKPFPCDQCGKGYGLKRNLDNHKKTHKT